MCLRHNSKKERLLRCLGLTTGMRTFLISAEVQQLKESNLRNWGVILGDLQKHQGFGYATGVSNHKLC